MKIRLSAYAWHTLATKAKVYAKTVSNPEWTLIKTNDDAEEIAPVFPNAKRKQTIYWNLTEDTSGIWTIRTAEKSQLYASHS